MNEKSTVLTITDSLEGTSFDLLRCTSTVKDFDLDPLAVVPRIVYKDNSFEENDVSEMLDYVFGECDFSAMSIGFLTEPQVIDYIADKISQKKTCKVVCCPSMISDKGEILVDSDVYAALCDKLLKHVDYLIVNLIEAEAFCGFECNAKNDFLRAAKKIYNVFGCTVFIKGGTRTDGQNVLFDGSKPVWVDSIPCLPGYEDKYSFLTAISCELINGNPPGIATSLALEFIAGTSHRQNIANAENSLFTMQSAEEAMKAAAMASKSASKDAAKAAAMAAYLPQNVEQEKPVEPVKEESEPVVAAKPEREPAKYDKTSFTPVPEFKTLFDSKPFGSSVDNSHVTSSLITPGKSLRDIARDISPSIKPEVTETAKTSNIEKDLGPKGEVTDIASSRFKFDTAVHNSITELQSLKDRLEHLNKLADSGK